MVEELARAASVNIIDLGVDLLLFSSNCDDLLEKTALVGILETVFETISTIGTFKGVRHRRERKGGVVGVSLTFQGFKFTQKPFELQ